MLAGQLGKGHGSLARGREAWQGAGSLAMGGAAWQGAGWGGDEAEGLVC